VTLRAALALGAVIFGLAGCPSISGGSGARPEGHRLLEGRVRLSEDLNIGRQGAGVQLAAAVVSEVEGEPTLSLFTSDVLPPDKGRAVAFALSVPKGLAFHLLLQAPGPGRGPGPWLGLLRFADGNGREVSLIPAGGDLDFGVLEALENGPGVQDNTLVISSAHNPLGQLDSDGDGTPDLVDDDDDGDGVPDLSDPDVAGDDIDDIFQELSFLPDSDGDGVPDAFDPAA
jgi:hypothetical protein